MRSIGVDERRARLGVRHLLAVPGATPADVAEGMVALHATDPATVFLSVYARTASVSVADIESALYEDRTLLRLLAMRRTMFAVPVHLAPAVQASCVRAVGDKNRKLYQKLITDAGHGDAKWLAEVEDAAVASLEKRGEATASEVSTDEPRLRSKVSLAEGKDYGRETTITTWVMALLAADGRVARGRPIGSWTSSQWRWSPMDKWLPGGMPQVPVEQARAELAAAWLSRFGPGTAADLKWWTGWTATQVKHALTAIGAVAVDLDGATGYLMPDDLDPVEAPKPWVALLPGLDPTPMGWSQREWYLGPHGKALFDTTGNICPTVWCDGRIVGGWVQRPDGSIAYELLEDVGKQAVRSVERAAARLSAWLGDARVSARGRRRAPLEQALLAR
jgi:hypothetical protein